MMRKFKFFDGISEDIYILPSYDTMTNFTRRWNSNVRSHYQTISSRTVSDLTLPIFYSSSSLHITDDIIASMMNSRA